MINEYPLNSISRLNLNIGSTYLRDRLDLCAQLLLDPVEGEAVVVRDQVNGYTQVTEPGIMKTLSIIR